MAGSIWPGEAADAAGFAVIASTRVQKPPYSKRIRKPMRRLIRICMIAACGLGWVAFGEPAAARPQSGAPAVGRTLSLREILGRVYGGETQRHATPPPVARYTPDKGEAFVLDRSTGTPLLRFEDSQEIWVLQPQPGPRGDIIYKNDVGEPVLRYTKLGGVTLFTDDRPDGEAAALVGEAGALKPAQVLSPNALLQRLAQASARSSRVVQRLVVFDAPDVTGQTAYLFADAAMVTADAVTSVGRHGDGRRAMTKLVKVLLIPGHKPNASFNDGVLQVIIEARQGVAGRPSSRRIAFVLLGGGP